MNFIWFNKTIYQFFSAQYVEFCIFLFYLTTFNLFLYLRGGENGLEVAKTLSFPEMLHIFDSWNYWHLQLVCIYSKFILLEIYFTDTLLPSPQREREKERFLICKLLWRNNYNIVQICIACKITHRFSK